MKRTLITFIILALWLTTQAQKVKTNHNNKTMTQIEDRLALKELVDIFSILADQKKTQEQTLLFTENAEVVSIMNGLPSPPLVGRKQLGETFANFLNLFETVYHLNGQQTVSISGNFSNGNFILPSNTNWNRKRNSCLSASIHLLYGNLLLY